MSSHAFEDLALQVAPGDGLVARFPEWCLIAFPNGEGQLALLEQLIATGRRCTPGAGRGFARAIVDAVAMHHAQGTAPPLCALCADDRDVIVLLHGSLRADITGPGGTDSVSGYEVVNWTERRLDDAIDRIEITPEGVEMPQSEAPLDLQAGVVPGGGLRLLAPRDTSVGIPPVAQTPNPEHAFVAVVLTDAVADEPRAPLPIAVENADDLAVTANDDAAVVLVAGYRCGRGHFNSPDAAFCGVCGLGMAQLTHRPVRDVRPPLGYLVLDDGAIFLVDRDYVIGRDPGRDADVQAGRAAAISLTDHERKISRTHANVVLDEWKVTVVDRGSANGTFLQRPGDTNRIRLKRNEPVTIGPGTRIAIGTHTIVFDSHYEA
jgi:hypothetical protein